MRGTDLEGASPGSRQAPGGHPPHVYTYNTEEPVDPLPRADTARGIESR